MASATEFAGNGRLGDNGTLEDEVDIRATLRRLRWLANILDTAIRLPGGFRFGADTFIGLTPVAGDIATTLIACYFVYEGKRLGLPRSALTRMAGNVALDILLGATPILGDLADTIFKANIRNLAIIEAHVGRGVGRG